MSDGQARWEELSEELLASDPAVSRSTMMGLPCLRFDGAFFAARDERNDELIVKLAADDVAERIVRGEGRPFAPAGKVFREWLAIAGGSQESWRTALRAALEFASKK